MLNENCPKTDFRLEKVNHPCGIIQLRHKNDHKKRELDSSCFLPAYLVN